MLSGDRELLNNELTVSNKKQKKKNRDIIIIYMTEITIV